MIPIMVLNFFLLQLVPRLKLVFLFSSSFVCLYQNNITGVHSFCSILTSKYNRIMCTIDWDTFLQLHPSVCVWASSLAVLSDHRECDKWMCQSLMEHCDCSARHKAITRLYRQSQRKILFQSTTHNLEDKERCSVVDRKSRALVLKDNFLLRTLNLLVFSKVVFRFVYSFLSNKHKEKCYLVHGHCFLEHVKWQ